jgi:hypothetical protein
MDQPEEELRFTQLCQSVVYYYPEVNTRAPSSQKSKGAYLVGSVICRQKGYVPLVRLAHK